MRTLFKKKKNYKIILNILKFYCHCYFKFRFWRGNYSWENLLTNMAIAIHCHSTISRCVLNLSMSNAQYVFRNSVSFQAKVTYNSGGETWW